MRILHLSDTHGLHKQFPLWYYENLKIDLVIHTGDVSNWRNSARNFPEVQDFLEWYQTFPAPQKILVPGNHDTSLFHNLVTKRDVEKNGIIYLVDNMTTINGLNIYGSPMTPTFGTGWAWNQDRHLIRQTWNKIPSDIDILCTHGPPFGILDFTFDSMEKGEPVWKNVGCMELRNTVTKLKPKAHLFGHVHNNSGTMLLNSVLYSNASCVTDMNYSEYASITSLGNILDL